jgi:hypothetical protein
VLNLIVRDGGLVGLFLRMSFICFFVTLFGTFAIVLGLVQLIGSHQLSSFGFSPAVHPIGDAVTRVVVLSGLVTLVGLPVVPCDRPRSIRFVRASSGRGASFVGLGIPDVRFDRGGDLAFTDALRRHLQINEAGEQSSEERAGLRSRTCRPSTSSGDAAASRDA